MLCRDLDELTPEMQRRWGLFREYLKNAVGCDVFVVETYRPQKRQDELYAAGRTTPGPKKTNAKHSKHTDRVAVDYAFVVPKGANIYGPFAKPSTQAAILRAAKYAGLVSGGGIKGLVDWPHVEMGK